MIVFNTQGGNFRNRKAIKICGILFFVFSGTLKLVMGSWTCLGSVIRLGQTVRELFFSLHLYLPGEYFLRAAILMRFPPQREVLFSPQNFIDLSMKDDKFYGQM